MKNLAKALVGIAAIITIVVVISRLAHVPIMGVGPRSLTVFSILLLLFAIALEGL